jgi:hypothetical protein
VIEGASPRPPFNLNPPQPCSAISRQHFAPPTVLNTLPGSACISLCELLWSLFGFRCVHSLSSYPTVAITAPAAVIVFLEMALDSIKFHNEQVSLLQLVMLVLTMGTSMVLRCGAVVDLQAPHVVAIGSSPAVADFYAQVGGLAGRDAAVAGMQTCKVVDMSTLVLLSALQGMHLFRPPVPRPAGFLRGVLAVVSHEPASASRHEEVLSYMVVLGGRRILSDMYLTQEAARAMARWPRDIRAYWRQQRKQ